MKKDPSHRIQDLIGLVNACYPPALAEEWDNVGLQVGDPAAPLSRVLICLDPTEQALQEAVDAGAEAVLAHHPLLLKPLKNLTPAEQSGRVVLQAVRQQVAVISAHTNLDRGANGLNDWLAGLLGVLGAEPLATERGGELVKLVVFVPTGYEQPVAEALFKAGAGTLGNYDRCSFSTVGSGSFRPGQGSEPFRGRPEQTERVREVRLETILPRTLVHRVVERMSRAHPYEEPAFDLIPLANRRADIGLGRIGKLAAPQSLEQFAGQVKQALGAAFVRVVGRAEQRIKKVALCGGSGASLLGEAARRGADLLVTGDVKYHEARAAEEQGVALIDAGHFATERIMVKALAETLRKKASERKLELEFVEMEGERDPFRVV